MQIELSNINKIKHASIEVGGLTVITGINDSGKSTVGKALFCAIKALSSSEGDSLSTKPVSFENVLIPILNQTTEQH